MSKEVVDYFRYEIWAHDDESVTLTINCDEETLDVQEAISMLNVLRRCVEEEFRETQHCYTLDLYQDGQTSANWRDDESLTCTLAGFLWAKRSVHIGTYGALIPMEPLPRWVLNTLGLLEYGVAKAFQTWYRVSGGRGVPDVGRARRGRGGVVARDVFDELPTAPLSPVEHRAGNVVWLRAQRPSRRDTEAR